MVWNPKASPKVDEELPCFFLHAKNEDKINDGRKGWEERKFVFFFFLAVYFLKNAFKM